MNVCLIIPHYNHHVAFSDFLPKLLACDLPIVIVDDGSSDESLSALEPLLENNAQVHFFKHSENRGKGMPMGNITRMISHSLLTPLKRNPMRLFVAIRCLMMTRPKRVFMAVNLPTFGLLLKPYRLV